MVKKQFQIQQQAVNQAPFMPIEQRQNLLKALKRCLQTQAVRIADAICADFKHRSRDETFFLEVYTSIQAINYALKHLKSWVKPRKRRMAWQLKPAQAYLMPQPLGVVGIIVPWNYPLFLAMAPLVSAIAAGNRVMVKMSESTPQFGQLLSTLLLEAGIDESQVCVINGDVGVAKEFTQLPFKHLLFTGSSEVGKHVMRAASDNLTPVTLELGGKSPVIIDEKIDDKTLRRIVMGKLFNAGQTCIAPDFLLLPRHMNKRIEQLVVDFVSQTYPSMADNPDYSSIINEQQFKRLQAYLEDAKQKGARVVQCGEDKQVAHKLPLHLLFDVNDEMEVMKNEIFGPLLPIVNYDKFDEVIEFMKNRNNPLAMYYFGHDKRHQDLLMTNTLSGALVINETMLHAAVTDLPFGGVGYSGMGRYNATEGFNTFSQLKPVFKQSRWSQAGLFYPPYGRLLKTFLQRVVGIQLSE